MKNHGIRRFDNLLNLCLYSAVTNIDLIPLSERIRLTERRLEKVLFARMLAMIIIEYLKDINDLLGFKLIGELNSNKYSEFVPEIKKINSEFADIRKKHEKILMVIRNNISAHKTKESLNLIHYIFNLDTDEICSLAIATININTLLTSATTKIYHIILKEAENNKSQANR